MKRAKTTPWEATRAIPILNVTDIEDAVEFYNKLQFEEDWRYSEQGEDDDPSQTTHVGLMLGDVSMMIALCDDKTAIHRQNIYFTIRDIDAYHSQLKVSLGSELPELVAADYGMRDFSLTDPWGHMLSFGDDAE